MRLDDFVKRPGRSRRFAVYVHPQVVSSPLGDFTVQLMTGIETLPDEMMLTTARDLVDRFRRDKVEIATLVHREYEQACEDVAWLDPSDEIPRDLTIETLAPYLPVRTLSVSRYPGKLADSYAARVYLSPYWDEEHGLYFRFADDEWRKVNG